MYGVKTGGFANTAEATSYFNGVADGFKTFAHWRDGCEFVGTTGMTLAEAQDQLEDHRRQVTSALDVEARDYHKGHAEAAAGVNGDYQPREGETKAQKKAREKAAAEAQHQAKDDGENTPIVAAH